MGQGKESQYRQSHTGPTSKHTNQYSNQASKRPRASTWQQRSTETPRCAGSKSDLGPQGWRSAHIQEPLGQYISMGAEASDNY